MASIHSDSATVATTSPATVAVIDGVPVPKMVAPESSGEIASMLLDAAASGLGVVLIGGGTKLLLGNIPARIDFCLSTLKVNRVLHYEPTDMTLSVETGARFGDVQSLLAERGQTLPIESADDPNATIGGLIATAIAGPRRLGSGTLRDLLIGISVAYPSGGVGKAGGLVVKNVTGFDLMRLHLGALGTLGVVVSANFKVLPLARTEATVLSRAASFEEAAAGATAARATRLKPVAIEIFKEGSSWRNAVRFEGRAETVEIGVAAMRGFAGESGEKSGDESRTWWRKYVDRQSIQGDDEGIVIRCGTRPKGGAGLARGIESLLRAHDISPELFAVSPALGQSIIRFNAAALTSIALPDLQRKLLEIAEAVTVLKAPIRFKTEIDVWGRVPETVSVMRDIKREFDPTNVLNPGRYVDRM